MYFCKLWDNYVRLLSQLFMWFCHKLPNEEIVRVIFVVIS